MSELLPCPFCHAQAKIGYACGDYFVHCSDRCPSPMCDHASESTTVCSWNDWAEWYEKNRRAQPENEPLTLEDVIPRCTPKAAKLLRNGMLGAIKVCAVGDNEPLNAPKTNADRIRSMSDEELAEFLRNIRDCGDYEELKFIGGVCMDYVSVIEWLQQPAKEEHNEINRR